MYFNINNKYFMIKCEKFNFFLILLKIKSYEFNKLIRYMANFFSLYTNYHVHKKKKKSE